MANTHEFVPRILSIAGTDPSGGAGMQADLKSIAAAGGYGMGVVTALVAQNTQGVRSVHTPDTAFLKEQLAAVVDDVEIDAVKIGMLGSREIVEVITEWVRENKPQNVVLDPVIIATSGDRLLDDDALSALQELISQVDIITPNVPELALLAGQSPACDYEELLAQASALAEERHITVIAKTGHLSGDEAGNAIAFPDGTSAFASCPRIDTKNTHGTGCSLSSALATRIGAGNSLADALNWTTRWLNESIRYADELNVGHVRGPIDHGHRARRMERAAMVRPPLLTGHFAERVDLPETNLSVSTSDSTPAVENLQLKSFFGQEMSIPPAGPHTAKLWDLISDVIEDIDEFPSLSALGSGNLDNNSARLLLTQEIWYLRNIFPAMSMLSIRATEPQDQILWSSIAQDCLVRCLDLNDESLGLPHADIEKIDPTGPSRALLDAHLSASAFNSYAVAASTMVAELWIVAELMLKTPDRPEVVSSAEAWIDTYSDDAFLDSAQLAVVALERALSEVSRAEQLKARAVFRRAAEHERDYFAQLDRSW